MTAADLLSRLSLPVICAPMFLVSGPELVEATCRAGIIGALPAANARTPEVLSGWLDRLDAMEGAAPYALNVGVKFAETPRGDAALAEAERRRVPIVITANGNPAALVARVNGYGGLVFHDATTLAHARKAAAAGVDGLILVCGGGGGHAGIMNPFALVPQVRRFFDGIIVLAGAIATGGAIRAAQVLGADLVYIGTRFIATQESMAPEAYKQMLVAESSSDILYTPAFTHGVPANFLTASMRAAGFDPAALPDASGQGDKRAWRDIWGAGQSVGLIDDVPPAAELVARLRHEYDEVGRVHRPMAAALN